MSHWCHSTLCGHPLPALTDTWTHAAASRHTIAPISHTRNSPRSRSYYSFPVPLRVGGWVGLSTQWVSNLLKVACSGPGVSRTCNLSVTSTILYHITPLHPLGGGLRSLSSLVFLVVFGDEIPSVFCTTLQNHMQLAFVFIRARTRQAVRLRRQFELPQKPATDWHVIVRVDDWRVASRLLLDWLRSDVRAPLLPRFWLRYVAYHWTLAKAIC